MGTYPEGVPYRGINRPGGEYLDEWDGWEPQEFYDIPEGKRLTDELALYASKGFNAIRFPISWERLQHRLQDPLQSKANGGTGYVDQVTGFVENVTAAGWLVVIDLHNYNRYATDAFDATEKLTPKGVFTQRVFGDGTLGVADLVDIWTKLASLFVSNSRVVFGLMNEPHDFPCDADPMRDDDPGKAWCKKWKIPSDIWFACLQQVIYAIRGTGADQLILVPNSRGSDVIHWDSEDGSQQGGPKDSVAALAIQDTIADKLAFDMHAYRDPEFKTYSEQMQVVTDWAKSNHKKLFLSELGVTNGDPKGKDALTDLFTYLNANKDVWLGWMPWDSGDPKKEYTLTVVDSAGKRTDGPQMPWYTPHLTPNTV